MRCDNIRNKGNKAERQVCTVKENVLYVRYVEKRRRCGSTCGNVRNLVREERIKEWLDKLAMEGELDRTIEEMLRGNINTTAREYTRIYEKNRI